MLLTSSHKNNNGKTQLRQWLFNVFWQNNITFYGIPPRSYYWRNTAPGQSNLKSNIQTHYPALKRRIISCIVTVSKYFFKLLSCPEWAKYRINRFVHIRNPGHPYCFFKKWIVGGIYRGNRNSTFSCPVMDKSTLTANCTICMGWAMFWWYSTTCFHRSVVHAPKPTSVIQERFAPFNPL